MIGYEYKITNKAGEFFTFNEGSMSGAHVDPLNVYALQTYPQFVKSIKNNELARNGQQGVWDFYSYYGRLSVTFSGIILAESELALETMKAKMQRVLSIPAQPTPTNDGYVSIEWTDIDGNEKFVSAKITNDITFDRGLKEKNVLSFNIQMKTSTPYVYSGGVGGEYIRHTGVRGYTKQGGIYLPTYLPASWNPTTNNLLSINNVGSSTDSPTVIRLFGEADQVITNPTVYNVDTGASFKVNTSISGTADYIEIDSINGTIKNSSGNDISGALSSGSTLISLRAGITNHLLYTSDQNPYITLIEPSAVIWVDYYKTYDN